MFFKFKVNISKIKWKMLYYNLYTVFALELYDTFLNFLTSYLFLYLNNFSGSIHFRTTPSISDISVSMVDLFESSSRFPLAVQINYKGIIQNFLRIYYLSNCL